MSRSSGEKDRNNELYQTKYQGLAIKTVKYNTSTCFMVWQIIDIQENKFAQWLH